MVTKLKNWNGDKTQRTDVVTKKIKLWPTSKTQIVTKPKNSNCDKTQKRKLWQKSKTLIVTKLELWQISIYEKKKKL